VLGLKFITVWVIIVRRSTELVRSDFTFSFFWVEHQRVKALVFHFVCGLRFLSRSQQRIISRERTVYWLERLERDLEPNWTFVLDKVYELGQRSGEGTALRASSKLMDWYVFFCLLFILFFLWSSAPSEDLFWYSVFSKNFHAFVLEHGYLMKKILRMCYDWSVFFWLLLTF